MKTLLVYSELSGFAINIKNHIFDALQELEIESKECYIEDVAEASATFRPTMHIFLHHNTKLYQYKDVITGLKGHKLLWTMEDPYESDVTFNMLDTFYYVFTSDENTSEALKKESKSNKIFYVPHACNPRVHRPVEVTYKWRGDDLFIGNAFPSRLKYFRDHAEYFRPKLITIIGVGYRGLDGYQHQRVLHTHINEEDMVKYICGHRMVLNLHRQNTDLDMANSRHIEASSFNNRYYEVWACGAEQMVIGRKTEPIMGPTNWKEAHEKHSYKKRLTDYYLPLLSL